MSSIITPNFKTPVGYFFSGSKPEVLMTGTISLGLIAAHDVAIIEHEHESERSPDYLIYLQDDNEILQDEPPVGFLWSKEDRNGDKFLGGVVSLGLLGEVPVVVLRNRTYTVGNSTPEFIMRVARSKDD
jgi:hypothetical protein